MEGGNYFHLGNCQGFTFADIDMMNAELRFNMCSADRTNPHYDEWEENEAAMIMRRWLEKPRKRKYNTDYRQPKDKK